MKTYNGILSLTLLLGVLFATGCKKDEDKNGLPAGKPMKFTLSTTGLQEADDFLVIFTGADVQGSSKTLFKVNGATQSNQQTITLTNEQFRAGQIVVETVVPLYTTVVGVTGYSATEGHNFTFNMEAVVDGKAQPVVTKTITTEAFSTQYTF